jgi:tRNA pseudouridine13 synthase
LSEEKLQLTEQYPVLTVENLAYAYGKPDAQAKFKVQSSDFIVREVISFEPEGEGTHAYLYIEKINTNTEWLARQLARFAGIEARDIGYAGLKDRNAVTSQWFSINLEGIAEPEWDDFKLDGVTIVQKTLHRKKLKRGVIKCNQFAIILKDIDPDSIPEIQQRVSQIKASGVPNYFAQQRFGYDYNNLTRAADWFSGRRKIKKRLDKSMAISASRSMVFNQMLSQRLFQFGWSQLLEGELMMLDGTHSIFSPEKLDDEIQQRFIQGDIHPTTALWGRGSLNSGQQLLTLEQEVAKTLSAWCDGLEKQGLKQERRAARLFPADIIMSVNETGTPFLTIELSFSLPSGSYATSVLRELVNY